MGFILVNKSQAKLIHVKVKADGDYKPKWFIIYFKIQLI